MYTQDQIDKMVYLHQQNEDKEYIAALQKEFPDMSVEQAQLIEMVINKTLDEVIKYAELISTGIINGT